MYKTVERGREREREEREREGGGESPGRWEGKIERGEGVGWMEKT